MEEESGTIKLQSDKIVGGVASRNSIFPFKLTRRGDRRRRLLSNKKEEEELNRARKTDMRGQRKAYYCVTLVLNLQDEINRKNSESSHLDLTSFIDGSPRAMQIARVARLRRNTYRYYTVL